MNLSNGIAVGYAGCIPRSVEGNTQYRLLAELTNYKDWAGGSRAFLKGKDRSGIAALDVFASWLDTAGETNSPVMTGTMSS